MDAPIDRVDRTQPGEFVKRTEKTGKDKKQNSFSKALKEKMEEELEKKKKKKQKDTVLITSNEENSSALNNDEKELPKDTEQSSDDTKPVTGNKIDVRA